jgi:hypothetical protein
VNIERACFYPQINPGLLQTLAAVVFMSVAVSGVWAADPAIAGGVRDVDPRLKEFFIAKERHARSLAQEFNIKAAPEMWAYFDAGAHEDWDALRKLWRDLSRKSGQYTSGVADESVRNLVWSPLLEAELAYECFTAMDMKFVETFARDTLAVIPKGAIYFGGTDPGRGVITAFVHSHADADPFFVLTQNALADGLYLKFLAATFGKKIYVPKEEDANKAFEAYRTDASLRLDEDRLKPGEKVSRKDGKVEFEGMVSVMAINGLLAKVIFEKNPTREFYIEESFPLEWMYPYLSPVGPIMKLNRQPVSALNETILDADRKYWRTLTDRFLGSWLTETSSVQTVCEFVEQVYADVQLDGFKGDPDYILADRNHSPRRHYGKLRLAQATLFEWRLDRATTPEETTAMKRAAELAYKQLLALAPDESEHVRRCARLFVSLKRPDDARRILETGLRINPRSKRLTEMLGDLDGPGAGQNEQNPKSEIRNPK